MEKTISELVRGDIMRKLSYEEFSAMIRDKSIFPELAGVTEEEIETYFWFYDFGRRTVRT